MALKFAGWADVRCRAPQLVVLAVVLVMAGCASITDSQRTKAEAITVLGTAGAVLGYLLAGKDGALILGSVGVAAGNAVADSTIKKKRMYLRNEQEFLSMTHAMEQSTAALRTVNAQLAGEILTLQRRRESLVAQRASLQERQQELAYQQQTLVQLITKTTDAIRLTDEQLAVQRQLLADTRAANTPYIKQVSLAEIQSEKMAQEREVLAASLQQLQSIDLRRLY